ncbi:agmatine deiminase family protein [Candidatus Cloacimonadota bacterium]
MRILLTVIVLFIFFQLAANQPVIHRPPTRQEIEQPRIVNRDEPTGFEIINPAEFGRTDGIFLAWAGWDTQLIADIAFAVSQEYMVFMLVTNAAMETQATDFFISQNVNMDNVFFIHDANISNTSMWVRDYAPFFIKEDGAQAIDDFWYGTYWQDDLISYTIADTFDLPIYDSPLMHHGGNHISDGNGMGFFSTNIYDYNPSYSQDAVKSEFRNFFGMDSLVAIQAMEGDATGHIDMFCKLLSDTLFIVGEYDEDTYCYPGDRELLNDLADYFGTLTNLDGRQFTVERIPMPPYTYGGAAGTINYTYTNSLIVNDLVLVPVYGFDMDAEALQIYEDLMPGYDIIPINSSFIIEYWGAVHCVANSYYSENPLIIFHEQLEQIENGDSPVINFRLNPKFNEAYSSVFYKPYSANEFTEVTATLDGGIWSAQLPVMTNNFHYYLSGTAISGDFDFNTTLPEDAPTETFYVECAGASAGNDLAEPVADLHNFPNPFNPSTTISFQISDFSEIESVQIEIFNLKGQKVKQLVCDQLSAGQHSLVWHGDDNNDHPVSSGIYLYRLNVNGKTATVRKCLLMK